MTTNHFEQRMLACSISQMQWSGMNYPSQLLHQSISFLTQLAECISVCWFTTLNTSLHESTLQLWKDGRHLSLIQNIYYFIMCPLTTKRALSISLHVHSEHQSHFTVRETKQIKLFCIGLAKAFLKLQPWRPPAWLSARALHGLRCLISWFLVHKAGRRWSGSFFSLFL